MSLKEQIERIISNKDEQFKTAKPKKWTFTLEAGKGQTYEHSEPVLYGHSTYSKSSVLAGRPQRVWVEKWDSWEEAREAIATLKKEIKGFKVDDCGPEGGSSHIDIDVMTAHLPDGPDQ